MAPHAESPIGGRQDPLRADSLINGFASGISSEMTNGITHGLTNGFANGFTNRIANSINDFHLNELHAHLGRSSVKQNILFIMADQMSACEIKMYNPESKILTPTLDKLAEGGVVLSAYCNSPLCAPSRFCMVSGQLPSKIGAYDNAADFASDVPTFAHALRSEGYETTLAGKMHFIGPDQLHGYENRLTTDIYPADYGWGVNWDKPEERQEWYHNMSSVYQAGICGIDNQLTYDDEVFHKSRRYLQDYVRQPEDQIKPFFLTVSFTHPHDPYSISRKYWDRYEGVDIPLPKNYIEQEDQDPHSQRILKCIDLWGKKLPDEDIKKARRAYFGACSYVDDQIAGLLETLEDLHLRDNTIIIFSGDHGDMLGDKGLWYKMSWYERSARVPLLIHYPPLFQPRRVKESISTMDLGPTLADMIGSKFYEGLSIDGRSFYPALKGEPITDEVFGEYMGEGTISPTVMIRRGAWKYVFCADDPPQLFNLEEDPEELTNLAAIPDPHPKLANLLATFQQEVADKWDLERMKADTLASQRRRRKIFHANMKGKITPWDWQPTEVAAKQFIRSNMPLDDLEKRARYPPVEDHGNIYITAHPKGMAGARGE